MSDQSQIQYTCSSTVKSLTVLQKSHKPFFSSNSRYFIIIIFTPERGFYLSTLRFYSIAQCTVTLKCMPQYSRLRSLIRYNRPITYCKDSFSTYKNDKPIRTACNSNATRIRQYIIISEIVVSRQ